MNNNIKKPTILLVEDNELIRCITARMIERLHCHVDTAKDGFSALLAIAKPYDLIFLDIGLPDISGIEVCKKIKEVYPDFSTPIIAYTACGDIIESQCREAGVSDFMVKPMPPKRFAEMLERWIPNYVPPNKK